MPIEGPDLFPPVKVVAVTGGIGSGKSAVGDMLQEMGFPIIDTDRIAHDLSKPRTEMTEQIRQRFGVKALAADGSLDRAALREIVFNHPDARKDLESITHPAIYKRMLEMIAEAKADGHGAAVLQIPLLFESPPPMMIHLVVYVACDLDVRVKRIMKRNPDMEESMIRKVMAAQMAENEKMRRSDVVIDNSSDLDHTRRQVQELAARIQSL